MAKKIEFVDYKNCGLEIRIPKFLKVRGDLPFFEARGRKVDLTIQLNPADFLRSTLERDPSDDDFPPTIPCRLIRKGSLQQPYLGKELVLENRMGGLINLFVGWTMCLYPSEKCFVHVRLDVSGQGVYEKETALWSDVMNSIRVDADYVHKPVPAMPSTKVTVGTENNLFVIGPKKLPLDGVTIPDRRDVEQGFLAAKKYVYVFIPSDCLECEIAIEFSKTMPDVSQAIQAFAVPIEFERGDEPYSHAVSGPCLPLKIPAGKYDLVVRLFKNDKVDKDDDPELYWRASLTFLPRGTVDARVFKLAHGNGPTDAFVRS